MAYKIIVAHPGRQHSFQTAIALKKRGMLCKYVTTIYDSKNSKILNVIKKVLPKDDLERVQGRKIAELQDSDILCFCELSGIIEAALNRIDKKRSIYRWWHNRLADRFGKKVAMLAIREHADAVIMYDTTAKRCFQILSKRAPYITRIMDCSAANRLYMKQIYQRDAALSPEYAQRLLRERGHLLKEHYSHQLELELAATELFVVPSQFVKTSLVYSNVTPDQIVICPYGTNFKPQLIQRKPQPAQPLQVLYVGNATAMKGIHYLLQAADCLKGQVELTVVGAFDNSDHIFDPYLVSCNFVGRVLHREVQNYLKKADVFVFPSLGEGLSLSVLEAMSCGLPCIVSENSGANDAIEDGVNGFVIKPQSVDEIVEKLTWCLKNREKLPLMGKAACETAERYTWSAYEERLTSSLNNYLGQRSKSNRLTIYTNEELLTIHRLELEALQEIIRICDKLGINYFLIDGAALGAKRHNGFIPWDDDIDVGMTREDYRIFLEAAPKLLSNKYFLQTPYQDDRNPYFYTKLRINGTEFVEFCNRKLDIHHGVYVDICPFDEVPDNEKQNKRQFRRCQFLIRLFALRQSPELSAQPTTRKRKLLAAVRFILHCMMQIVPYQWLSSAIERETTRYNGTEQAAYAFLHHPRRKTDYIFKTELFPLEECKFDDILVNIPFDCDAYLKRHYGDYTKWPEPEDRYGHKPYRVKL